MVFAEIDGFLLNSLVTCQNSLFYLPIQNLKLLKQKISNIF